MVVIHRPGNQKVSGFGFERNHSGLRRVKFNVGYLKWDGSVWLSPSRYDQYPRAINHRDNTPSHTYASRLPHAPTETSAEGNTRSIKTNKSDPLQTLRQLKRWENRPNVNGLFSERLALEGCCLSSSCCFDLTTEHNSRGVLQTYASCLRFTWLLSRHLPLLPPHLFCSSQSFWLTGKLWLQMNNSLC